MDGKLKSLLWTGDPKTTQRSVQLYGAETWRPPSEPKSASTRMKQTDIMCCPP